MTKIKICGLTRIKDIEYVNRYQPDYVGFIFAESRRRITPHIAKELIRHLSPDIKKVGVFVNEHVEKVMEIGELCNLDVLQLHGDETPYYCSLMKKPVWKGVRVQNVESVSAIKEYDVEAVLLDTYSKSQHGGTGKIFDWNLARYLDKKHKLVLAGGINSSNVNQAVEMLRPFCIDVSSSVETNGVKDAEKIREIIEKVRLGEIKYA